MQNNELPSWLTQKQEYAPEKDKELFINSSSKRILSVLSRLKKSDGIIKAQRFNTSLRLFAMLLLIVLTSCASNFYFVFVMLAVSVVRIALLKANAIKSLVKVLAPAEIFAFIILLPSAFMGNAHAILSVMARVFVSVTLVMGLNLSVPFTEITASLSAFHIPDVVIFTFDTTIKYIFILGDICSQMLTALKVRSIGKNKDKSKALSGIIGTAVIKSQDMAKETNNAMECRGFNGVYKSSRKKGLKPADAVYIFGVLLLVVVFIYFERVMK